MFHKAHVYTYIYIYMYYVCYSRGLSSGFYLCVLSLLFFIVFLLCHSIPVIYTPVVRYIFVDDYSHGFVKHEDPLGIQRSPD